MKQKQTFTRGTIYNSEGKTTTFVVNFWQDKSDKERIWMASKDILVPTEINNHPNSVNYHPKLFSRLKEILMHEDQWN
ncbi:hypothetical protein P4603_10950 [Priestia aryabhattai]|uniref:hypothetical protein n=1 Tax=Priestia aryabhattai TaxID=412384 RepID=UPI002E22470A|nr:hypothetical protein [Priestia aryabhattai]